MAIVLNHTIVPAHDKDASAKFFARIFGIVYEGAWGHFAPVRVNESLTLDFDNRTEFEGHHYALLASDEEFDAILNRVREESVSYGSGPSSQDDGEINRLHQGRGFYFHDSNGHSWEIITHTYITD